MNKKEKMGAKSIEIYRLEEIEIEIFTEKREIRRKYQCAYIVEKENVKGREECVCGCLKRIYIYII